MSSSATPSGSANEPRDSADDLAVPGIAKPDRSPRLPSRRLVLAAVGVAAVGAAGIGYAVESRSASALTVTGWTRKRGALYVIGHRGSGDVRPEHTMQAYAAARGWGAQAMEISASSTSDGVLVCMHDLTFDRTTNTTGLIHDRSSTQLSGIGVLQPQLGPFWTRAPLPAIPLLEDVLIRFGNKVILCIEPKRDDDYTAVLGLIEQHKLTRSVIVKLFHTSKHIGDAQAAGYPVFGYLASSDVSADSIRALADRLDASRDYLVLPTSTAANEEYLPDELLAIAVSTRLPVWVYPVHRRSEAEHYRSRGVSGMISASVGYQRGALSPVTSDSWASQAIAPGELTRVPASTAYQPQWPGQGVLTLGAQGKQHFLTLGQFAPLAAAAGTYTIDFDCRWDRLPTDLGANISLAFGHSDDRYYEHQLGVSDGYHAVLRANGSLELYKHRSGNRVGTALADAVVTPAPVNRQWLGLRLEVTPNGLRWTRTDTGATLTSADGQFRGGYFHLGRSSMDGAAGFRHLTVS